MNEAEVANEVKKAIQRHAPEGTDIEWILLATEDIVALLRDAGVLE